MPRTRPIAGSQDLRGVHARRSRLCNQEMVSGIAVAVLGRAENGDRRFGLPYGGTIDNVKPYDD